MRRLIVISGAGLSAESGIRTFRTDEVSGKALWDEFDLEEVCEITAFDRGFRRYCGEELPGGVDEDGVDLYTKTNDFYNLRRKELATVHPNLAHLRISEWFSAFPGQVVNLTTNVDDLLERAGVPKDETLYIHGYLKEVIIKSAFTQQKTVVDIGYEAVDIGDHDWIKPNVVFFGECPATYQVMNNTLCDLNGGDLIVVVGCSNQVIRFVSELLQYQKWGGYKIVVVNPKPDPFEVMKHGEGELTLYKAGAVETFSNPHFIKMVEDHLEDKTCLQKL